MSLPTPSVSLRRRVDSNARSYAYPLYSTSLPPRIPKLLVSPSLPTFPAYSSLRFQLLRHLNTPTALRTRPRSLFSCTRKPRTRDSQTAHRSFAISNRTKTGASSAVLNLLEFESIAQRDSTVARSRKTSRNSRGLIESKPR